MADGTAACLVQRRSQPHRNQRSGTGRVIWEYLMTSRDEREQQSDAPRRREDLMREAPPPSVFGDVEDAVAPEEAGELTPWSPPEPGEENGDA